MILSELGWIADHPCGDVGMDRELRDEDTVMASIGDFQPIFLMGSLLAARAGYIPALIARNLVLG